MFCVKYLKKVSCVFNKLKGRNYCGYQEGSIKKYSFAQGLDGKDGAIGDFGQKGVLVSSLIPLISEVFAKMKFG